MILFNKEKKRKHFEFLCLDYRNALRNQLELIKAGYELVTVNITRDKNDDRMECLWFKKELTKKEYELIKSKKLSVNHFIDKMVKENKIYL